MFPNDGHQIECELFELGRITNPNGSYTATKRYDGLPFTSQV
jgi:hypothetical protein